MDPREELAALRRLAELEAKAAKSASQQQYDPTEGMSEAQKFLAGAGKSFYDIGRGAGQALGLVSRADVEEARRLDAPLMRTGAGVAGDVTGSIATALPSFAIPGANTLRGAAAIGALQGALQPSISNDENIRNIGVGVGAGAGGVAIGRMLAGGWQGANALAEPFSQAGQERIAGRVISRFAVDPAKVASAQGGKSVTGAVPTIAEETGDFGMARLQDAVNALDPQIAYRINARLTENNAARIAALDSMAGDESARKAADAARRAVSEPYYQKATSAMVEVTPELEALLSRPSVKQAIARAANIAAEEGRPFIGGQGGKISGQSLQDLKMGMDALLKDHTTGLAGKEAANVKSTRDALVSWMERQVPDFNAARTTYAAGSKPINQMDIAEYVRQKGTSATSDLEGNQRLMPNALARLLQDEGLLIERATGRNGLGKKLSDVLTPDQENMLRAIVNEVDRSAAVARAGNGPGSATAQRMAAQNVLSRAIGPTGLPQSWAESTLANTAIGKPLNLIYGGIAEPKIQQALADAVLNPMLAAKFMQQAKATGRQIPDNALRRLAEQAARVTPSSIAVSSDR